MKEIELAFLCRVFNETLDSYPEDVAEWYHDTVSQNEEDFEAFVKTCAKQGKDNGNQT